MDERQGTGLDTTNQWSGQNQDRPSRGTENGSAPEGPARVRRIKKLEIESLRKVGRAQMGDMRKAGAGSSAEGNNVRIPGIDDIRRARAAGASQGTRTPGNGVSQSGRVSVGEGAPGRI